VVSVSSAAHRGGSINFDDLQGERRYVGWSAYSQSKLANILFSNELARRLAGTGVTSNALHPGVVATNFGQNEPGLVAFGARLLAPFFISPEKGARTSIYLATSPEVEGVTGKYFEKCRQVSPARAATDADTARRLWEVSARLTGLTS
jgi:NAD(P)-dependent dehydrogenase (short-subunit alcohol dehydrogenase family)